MEWDLIVVGAGSAGAALAGRVADSGKRVLLLEAGPDHRSAELPAVLRSANPMQGLLSADDWDRLIWPGIDAHRTAEQEASLYWRGRGVGGSSVINGQFAIRPSLSDFDEWAASGCTEWSAEHVLPYFIRLETDQRFGDRPEHGNRGPIPIHHPQSEQWGSVDTAFATAATKAGFPWAEDANAPGAHGLSPYPVNSRDAQRVTVNDGYLEPLRDSDRLKIRAGTLVDRVIFEGDRAVGVLMADGSSERAKQVVLSAGVVHSPAILLRSGIGLSDDLQRIGVTQLVDLPVGHGMQDHAAIDASLRIAEHAVATDPHERHSCCVVRFSSGDPEGVENDLVMLSLNQDVLVLETADTSVHAGAIVVWLNRPHSRGHIVLESADPRHQPLLRMNMLGDERDRRIMRIGVRRMAEIARSPEVAAIVAEPVEQLAPALYAAIDAADDAALDAWMIEHAGDTQHGTSSCAMSAERDGVGVVDPEFRVYGTRGLRVVDASVFPFVPSANTHLATVMLGERAADFINAEG